MIRLVFLFAIICLLTIGAVWLADSPGIVVINWSGYRVELSLVMLASAFVIFAAIIALIYRSWLWMKAGPGRIGGVFAEKRRLKGLDALTNGMVAIASGDADEARKRAVEAEKHLSDEPMTLLLAAQAAELNEDDRAAGIYYNKLVGRADTEFIGLKGLIARARKENDIPTALGYAKRAAKLRPNTDWVVAELLELHIHLKDWASALGVLEQKSKGAAAKTAAVRHKKAVLNYELGEQKRIGKQPAEALALSQAAMEFDGSFVPAAVSCIDQLTAAGKQRKAQKIVSDIWHNTPHPELATAFEHVQNNEAPRDFLARAQNVLAPLNPAHRETQLLLARASLKANEWGQARKYLTKALEDHPSKEVYQLLTELEEKANADVVASREWIVKSVDAPDDPTWICNNCGRQEQHWSILCPSCDSFDNFEWRFADRGRNQPLLLTEEAAEAQPETPGEFEPIPETLREVRDRPE